MANSRDIELVIRARDSASKSVKEIASNVDRLSDSVAQLGPKSDAGEAKLNELTNVAKELEAALQGLAKNKAVIERFKVLNATYDEAASKLEQLRKRAEETRNALSQATNPTGDQKKTSTAAATAFAAQEKVVNRLAQQMDRLRESADKVGIEFNDLEAAERRIDTTVVKATNSYRLINQAIDGHAAALARAAAVEAKADAALAVHARNVESAAVQTQLLTAAESRAASQRSQSTNSIKALTTAYSGLTTSGAKLAQSLGFSQTGERRSLSFLQRLRGEVLSVTASYLGLYAAIQGIGRVLDTVATKTTIDNTFSVAFGKDSAAQMKFVEAEADRLGFRYLALAESYGKFAVAARGANTSVRDTQTIFSSFTEVSRALNLGSDKTRLVFSALEQIMSKGKVTAEELRQQLGEQLPGVMTVFAKSLGISEERLNKLISTTGLSSKFIISLATAYRDKFAGTVESASKTPQAAMERFQTQLDKLSLTIAESGFADAFTRLLGDLTKFFQSKDGERFTQGLATLTTDLVKLVGFLVRNYETLGVAIGLAVGAKAVVGVANFVKSMRELYTVVVALTSITGLKLVSSFGALRNTLTAVTAAIPALGASLAVVAAAAAGFFGFWVGTKANEHFAAVRKFGVLLVGVFVVAFNVVDDAWNALYQKIVNGKDFTQVFMDRFSKRIELLADQYKLAGEEIQKGDEKLAAKAGSRARGGIKGVEKREAVAAAEAQVKEIAELQAKETLKAQLILQDKISQLRAESLKKDATNVQDYRKALEEEFAELYRNIGEFGKAHDEAAAKRLKGQLDAIINLRVQQAGNKFDVEKVRADEAEINDLLATRNKLIQQANQLRKVEGDESTDKKVTSISAEFNDQIQQKAQELLDRIEQLPAAVKKSLRTIAGDLQVVLKTQLQDLTDLSEIDSIRLEYEKIRDLTQARTNALQLQKSLFSAHLIDQKTYEASVARINNQYEQIVPRADELLKKISASTTLTEAQRQAFADIVISLSEIRDSVGAIDPFAARVRATLDEWAGSLGNVAGQFIKVFAQTRSIGDAWKAARQETASFFADLAGSIVKAIAKAYILKALLAFNSTSTGGGIIGTIVSALSQHTGGVTGKDGTRRKAMAEWFIGAPRLHNGGVPGLRRNEVPTILKKGEEVLTENDPRHVGNGGGSSPVNIYNNFDINSFSDALGSSPRFARVVWNVFKANKQAFRQAGT